MASARIVEEKKEEEDLIELRAVEKMVPRQFHKYLKVFEKKESIVKSRERGSARICEGSVEEGIH